MSTLEIQHTDDGSATLFVPELDEHYHSMKGATPRHCTSIATVPTNTRQDALPRVLCACSRWALALASTLPSPPWPPRPSAPCTTLL